MASRWQRHVAGIGFDARTEAANDGDDEGRFTDWETTSVYLARAATIDALEADYVGDAFEAPIVHLGSAFASRTLRRGFTVSSRRTFGSRSASNGRRVCGDPRDSAHRRLALNRSSGGIDACS